jgi:hypothetical protein
MATGETADNGECQPASEDGGPDARADGQRIRSHNRPIGATTRDDRSDDVTGHQHQS